MRGEVRAKNLELDRDAALSLINAAEYGVLAMVGTDGFPAAVALNHVLLDDVLYFHCGVSGEKLANLQANPRVSYFVTGEHKVHYDQFRATYSSALVEGSIEFVSDEKEALQAMRAICYRFASHLVPRAVVDSYAAERMNTVVILKLTPLKITGKARPQPERPGLKYSPEL